MSIIVLLSALSIYLFYIYLYFNILYIFIYSSTFRFSFFSLIHISHSTFAGSHLLYSSAAATTKHSSPPNAHHTAHTTKTKTWHNKWETETANSHTNTCKGVSLQIPNSFTRTHTDTTTSFPR